MFNALVGTKATKMSASVQEIAKKELNQPSSESLVVHALFGQIPEWPVEQHQQAFVAYRERRGAKSGIRFPRLFEAAIALELAERYRLAENFEACNRVIWEAADDFPECAALRAFAQAFDVSTPVRWREVLLPKKESKPHSKGSAEKAGDVTEILKNNRRKRRVLTPRPLKVRWR